MNAISKILATTEPIRQATGFVFTEGPVWHPDDVWYFNDIRPGAMYRMVLGEAPELIRKTEGGNGMTFDLEVGSFSVRVKAAAFRGQSMTVPFRCSSIGLKDAASTGRTISSVIRTAVSTLRIRRCDPFDRREQPGTDGEDGVYARARLSDFIEREDIKLSSHASIRMASRCHRRTHALCREYALDSVHPRG